MGFLSFSRKRKQTEPSAGFGSPPKRSFSGFSLRPRSFFEHHTHPHVSGGAEPPQRLERLNDTPAPPASTHERSRFRDAHAPREFGGRGSPTRPSTFHDDLTRSLLDASLERERADAAFAAFVARNSADDDGQEELLAPARRQQKVGMGERHSMFDAPCAPVEPLSKIPTNASLSLPPGAMEPTPPRIDFCAEVFSPIDWSFGGKAQTHARSMSCPMSDDMIRQNVPPPIVPPRSHLRTMSAHPMTPSSSASSSSAHGHSNGRQYVLDVAPPLAPRPAEASDEVEVISFGQQRRQRTERSGSFPSSSRDPFKVRDGVQPRKAASGVYTPNTFPGPSTSSLCRTPSNASAVSSAGLAPPPQCSSTTRRGLAGLKRISVGFARGSSSSAPSPALVSSPTAIAVPASLAERQMAPVARQSSASSTGHSFATDSSGRRFGHSPSSSTHSAASVSPPATPTTPRERPVSIADPAAPPREPASPTSPTSAGAPRMQRRKPVPRLDDALVSRLEALEVDAK